MADDIVTRLRDKTVMDWEGDEVTDPLCDEAADLIERLRAASNALAKAVATNCGDDAWADRALKAWEEVRRG